MTQIDPGVQASNAMGVGTATHEFRVRGQSEVTLRYLVQSSGGGWVEFEVDSFHGGTARQRAEIR